MNWKIEQIKREENKMSTTYNLTLDSIGWNIRNYHTDKLLKDMVFNLAKKIYLSDKKDYIIKLNSLPDQREVSDKIEEFEIIFAAIEKRSKR